MTSYSDKTYIINVQILRLSNVIACPIFNNTNCWDLLLNDLCKQSITNGFLEIKFQALIIHQNTLN